MKKKTTDNVFVTVETKKQKGIAKKLIGNIGEKYDVRISVISDDEQGIRIAFGGAVFNIISKHYNPDKCSPLLKVLRKLLIYVINNSIAHFMSDQSVKYLILVFKNLWFCSSLRAAIL